MARFVLFGTIAIAVVFFVLFGNAVYLTEFPERDQQILPLPEAPPSPRFASPAIPIPIPEDVTAPPVVAPRGGADSLVEKPPPPAVE